MAEASTGKKFQNMMTRQSIDRFIKTGKLPITEKDLQRQVEDLLKRFKWNYYHTWNSRHSVPGFPDVIALRRGRCLAVELKKEDEMPTPEQVDWLGAFSEVAFEVHVWRPSDFEKIVEILK